MKDFTIFIPPYFPYFGDYFRQNSFLSITMGEAGESGSTGAGLWDLSSSGAGAGAWLGSGKGREKGNWEKCGNKEAE